VPIEEEEEEEEEEESKLQTVYLKIKNITKNKYMIKNCASSWSFTKETFMSTVSEATPLVNWSGVSKTSGFYTYRKYIINVSRKLQRSRRRETTKYGWLKKLSTKNLELRHSEK
jgi:hypothetical protein